METIIVITECKNPYGKYWEFFDKQAGKVVAEVDLKSKKEFSGPRYFVYTERGGFLYESGRHSTKDIAINKAKKALTEQYEGQDVKFKWNVMTRKYK